MDKAAQLTTDLYKQRKKLIEQLRENERAILDFHSKIEVGDTVEVDWNFDYSKTKTWKRPDIRIMKIISKEYVGNPAKIFFHAVGEYGNPMTIIMPDALPAILEITKAEEH